MEKAELGGLCFYLFFTSPKNSEKDFAKKYEFDSVSMFGYHDEKLATSSKLDKKVDDDSIFGLITDNYSAGIVVNKDGYAVGLLNGNKDCSYAVFIGEGKAPGIITASENQEELLIKFIPIWAQINKGDEVITSGMDNIFFEGLKVGRIIEVTNLADMKIATVKPYVNVLKKKYFYTYENGNKLTNFSQMKNIINKNEKIDDEKTDD